ncbi:MAG: DsrE family protein [Betaproteobacteria bacterium]|nr:DsrE family protein [Betaproteobacteria bacterium]MDE2122617.1 DsrE family protein [Betaproteobacteria bacterium]MDE2186565.1 DsrE family protein [Betaproteobacteria bacterium]MDE2324077.1 DsrE family protein [Betaproteobacteria bacterium]
MNSRDRLKILGAGLAGLGSTNLAQAQSQGPVTAKAVSNAPWKVAMQISDGLEQAYEGLINIQNVLQLDPQMRFIVVGYGKAISFLLNGTKTPQGALFEGLIGDLANQGVQFKACENTLTFLKISKSRVVLEASFVPAGVFELVKLQSEGWYYIKP